MGVLASKLWLCQYYCMDAPVDANKIHEEKVSWELHKNFMYYFEPILEATPDKTATIQPLTSHFTNHPSKMNKTCKMNS